MISGLFARITVAGALALAACGGAMAQIAGKTITIVVPYSAGTGPDIMARLIGEELQTRWNQPVVIDNKPGASGNIGTVQVARAAPDGTTVLMTTNPFTNNVALFKNLPYDPVKNFEPVVLAGSGALALALHPSVPAKTTKEFIAYAKANPGAINYGSPGHGTPHHLAMELFKLTTGTDLKHIPYRGSAGATQDLVGGHVSAGFQAIHVILPIARNNQVTLTAVASRERQPIAPDLPSLAEQGLKDFHVDLWYALLVPAGTPKDVVGKFNTTVNEILAGAAIKEKLAKQGIVPQGGSAERLRAFIPAEIAKWQKVVKEAGITPAD
jgi:tripartite-type tricarboxylate transporter receptor subunit TctC